MVLVEIEGLSTKTTSLQNLEELDLLRTKITNKGVTELARLKKLRLLRLSHTQVTKAGVAELKKALPNCFIFGP